MTDLRLKVVVLRGPNMREELVARYDLWCGDGMLTQESLGPLLPGEAHHDHRARGMTDLRLRDCGATSAEYERGDSGAL
jgi:hypothetical protein